MRTTTSEIFVFGSNLAGRHGRGSAYEALRHHGARYGQGKGLAGNSYAIPTKDEMLNVLPLTTIAEHVAEFLQYANDHPERRFRIVAIGCGLAGYRPDQIGPMFRNAPPNCHLPEEFRKAGVVTNE